MRIAVTGGSGRVGHAIVQMAAQQGHEVVSIDQNAPADGTAISGVRYEVADCADYGALDAAIQGCDALVHMAAIPHPGNHPDHIVHNNNVQGSYNALYAATRHGIRRICQASSVNALGLAFSMHHQFDYFPLDEDHPTYCEEAYSLSKWICEQQADAFCRLYPDLRVASMRFHLVTPAKEEAAKVYVPRGDEAAKHLWGYTLFTDAARACLLSLTASYDGHEVFYITGTDTVHPDQSLDLASRHFPDVPITGDLSGRNSFFSVKKAERLLGFVPTQP